MIGDTQQNHSDDYATVDLKNFEKQEKYDSMCQSKYFQIINLSNRTKNIAIVSSETIDVYTMGMISSFYRKVTINLKLNHPAILKCIGYSLTDFKNKPKPTIITEFIPDKKLFFELNSGELNDTKKLINIFGIASAMAYLHSHNILHMNLDISCIFLDQNLYPKLSLFDHSREIPNLSENQVVKEQEVKGSIYIRSPEVISKLEYSKASDVFAFAILIYRLFQSNRDLGQSENILKGERPKFDLPIGDAYRKLIEKCWSHDPNSRPTFDQIVIELKTNTEFLTEKVDRDEYNKYIKFIDESHISFDERKVKVNLDEIMKQRTHTFIRQKVNINEPSFDGNCLDLSQYKLEKSLNVNAEYETFKGRCISNETKPCLMQVYSKEISCFNKHEMINFYRKINIISQLNHPAILNFVGWSPVNFDGKYKPVIVTEYCKSNLNIIRNMFTIFNNDTKWNSTKKLMCIYGIASAMSYLHSHDIIHRDLKPENIYLDDCFNLPKITGFDIANFIKNDEKSKKIKGSPAFLAPEVYSNKEYSKASDVYSFALVVFQILTGIKPFEDKTSPEQIKDELLNAKRPKCIDQIGEVYYNLIERCWSQDPKDRPTFEQIVNELKTNPDFIYDEIDKEDYFEYVNFINEFPIKFDPSKRIQQYDEMFEKIHTFEEIEPYHGLKNMYDTETNDLLFDYNYFNINDYQFGYEDIIGMFYTAKEITNENETISFVEKRVNIPFDNFTQSELINFSRELDIIPKLNHPAILNYIGYYPNSFNFGIPTLIMETAPKKAISENLDLTKKSIIIYGVASAMAYLHSHDIIHRDLKLENVYLNELFYPKLSGFNISKIIKNGIGEKSKKIKGSPAYLAPEIYSDKEYSKASDVYSFSLFMHELLTGKKPFEEVTSPKQISEELINNFKRPAFDETINDSYRDLIERCWSQDPKMRPTFDCIIEELKTNPKFILENVNQEEFYAYIKFIEETPISFDSSKFIEKLDRIIQINNIEFHEIDAKINFRNVYSTEYNNILTNFEFINFDNYQKRKLIQSINYHYKQYEIFDKKTKTMFYAEKSSLDIEYLFRLNRKKYLKEIINNLTLNHPSIMKFVGYSPVDFKKRSFPVYVSEYCSNGTLSSILELEKKRKSESFLNQTKRLIIIYGIASAMSYLHSHNVIITNLNPSNIYLDEFLFPKIVALHATCQVSENPIPDLSKMTSALDICKTDIYLPPETYLYDIKSTAGDVYAFALIVYQLITNEEPFEDVNLSIIKQICEQKIRPKFAENIPKCYQVLIEKCWSEDPNERPTFDEIIHHLQTNQEFITDQIDNKEFRDYINFIGESQTMENISQLDDFIKTKRKTFQKVQIDFSQVRKPSMDFLVSIGSVNLQRYEKRAKIGKGGFGSVYKIIEKNTNNLYAAKVSIYEIDQCGDDTIVNLSREINIISQLNHPAILQFIGFNPYNFKNKPKPIIITEIASNCSLDKILELERRGLCKNEWDDTKKLINIYGIASGMAYLHKKDILHRDLKPENILLDDYLYPKIADFGLSKVLYEQDKIESTNRHPLTSGFKGTYAYCAPEIIEKYIYTKASDVYAFAMIVYEIMTGEVLFEGHNLFQLIRKVLNEYRPPFKYPIPYSYRRLIEKCWNQTASFRPSFDKIVETLENDRSFITENVDEDEFLNYIYLVKGQEEEQHQTQTQQNTNNYKQDKTINKVSFDMKIIEDEGEENNEKRNFLDLKKFKRLEVICKSDFSKLYKFEEKETGKFYSGQMSMQKIKRITNIEKEKLSGDLAKIEELKHPSLLKFIGFSPYDFKMELKPVIVTEYASNGTLDDVIQMERKSQTIKGWDETKKLINIFGIASGMSYLHSHGIIHRLLKPTTIYLDDVLTPKIADFGLSTRFTSSDSISHQTISGIKASPVYSAPEVLLSSEYTKSSDVYSFSYIVYEIITSEIPFKEVGSQSQIFSEVVENQSRPKIKKEVPESYRKLIEKSWAQDPSERPTFDEIVFQLKSDPEFITEKVNKEEYEKYINFVEKAIENYGIINNDSNSMKCNCPEAPKIRNELKNDQEKLIDEVNNNTINDEKMIKRSSDTQTNEKIDEVDDNANNDEKMNKSGDVKIIEEIENDNSEDTTEIDKDTANAAESMRSGLDSVEESPVKIIENTEEVEHANCAEYEEESFVDHQNERDGSNLLQDRSVSIGEEQPDGNAAVHDVELVQQQNEHENKSLQDRSVSGNEEKYLTFSSYDRDLVQRCLAEKKPKELIQYLNDKCDYETTSAVFDKCQKECPAIYAELCKEGVSLDNAVGHHKYALLLAFSNDGSESDERSFKVARSHLEAAVRQGFSLSCFSLARLLHEHFKEDEIAFEVAIEGSNRGDKLSQCIAGHFISKGIGTKKNRREGVRMMLESGVEEYYNIFATDIGLYFLDLAKEEEEDKDDNYARAFEWFEKGYMMSKTTATINNYALCFLKGIFVEKDIEKAKCILKEGVLKGDPESMYNLAQILESTDIMESLEYYKRASSIGHKKSESRYSSLITEIDDGNLTK